MDLFIPVKQLNITDLNMYQCGEEACAPGHSFGPAVRDHFLIHYILKGKGFFQVGGETYHLTQGQGFLICPDMVTYYEADSENPWHYVWVGFHGLKAEAYLDEANLTMDRPIFRYDQDDFVKDCFVQMMETKKLVKSREMRLLGLLYLFLSQLIETADGKRFSDNGEKRKEAYVKQALAFIEKNYSRKISIAEIARDIGLDRSYLCAVFKQCLHVSPQHFLINYRMTKACELMQNGALSIGDISRSVGYEDPLLFSKMFKKMRKISPRAFRKDYTIP